ncbi:nuclear pore complex protein DDB_G0274915 isoform X2 [Calliphora vicina]|uniref:nuclear pore complex protein DDB_G0274915 isoform X2 n=1 Tax=Calliphora vicina TaxID=7373 RepID=UPI00325B9226
MGSEHYCLRWNNHQSNLLGVFSQLLQDESLVDVTLACSEGAPIRAHKVVLSACSSYFQSLFLDHPEKHPIVILKDVRFAELQTLVEFMYKGEVNVQYCQLSALLKTAESLKVKGLAEMTNQNTTLREPEREPERLRPHSQPCKRSNSCDSPVDATLSGPSTSAATSAAAVASLSSTQHAAALAASALTTATIASNAASSTSATTNATTCTIAPSATSLVAAAFSSSILSSHQASSVSSKREHPSERCSPSPPKRLQHAKHEQDSPLLPLDLYQRRLEQHQQQEDTKENAIVNNNNTNEKHRSTTPHTATSGTTQKHSSSSEGGGGGGSGSGVSGEGIKKRDDIERDSIRSFNSPDRLARHDVNRPTDDTMGGVEGMSSSGGVEKIEDVEDVEYGDEEMELDDDGDNNSEDVCLNMKIRSSSLAAALVSPQLSAHRAGLESSGHGGVGVGEGGVDSARSTPLTTTIPLTFDSHSQRPASRSSREGSGLDRPSSRGGLSGLPSTSASAMAGGLSPVSSTAAALGLHSDTVPGPSGLGPVQSVPLSLKKEIDCSEDDNSNSRHHLQPRSASASGVLGGELDYRTPHESLLRNFGMATRCPTPFAFPFTPLGLSLFDIDPSRILTMLHHQTWLAEEALRNRGLLTPPPTSKDFSQRFNPLSDLLSKDYHANHMHLNTADLLARSSLSSAALAASSASAAHFGGPTDLANKQQQQTQQHRSTPQQQQYKQQQPPFNIRYPSPAAFFHQQHQQQQLQQQLQTQKLNKSTRQSTPSPQQTATSSGPSLLSGSSSTSLSSLHKSSERSLTPCHKDDDNDAVIELTTSHHDEAAAIRDRDSGNSSAATTSSITSSMLYKDSLEQLLQRRHSSGMLTGESSLKSYSQLLLNSTTPTDTSSCKEKSSSSSTSSTPPPAPGTPGQLSLSRSSLLKSPSDTSSLFSEPIEEETRCIVCNAQFPNVWLLEQHAALQHPLLGPAYAKHKETNHRARLPADKLFTCDVCGMQFRYLKSFKKHRLNHALERLHGKKGKNPFAAHLQQQMQEHEMVSSSQEPNMMMADTETVEDLRINIKKERDEEEQQQQLHQQKHDEDQDATVDSAGLMSYQDNPASSNLTMQTNNNNNNEPNISSSEGIYSTNKRTRLLQASLESDSPYHSNHQQQQHAPPQHHPHTLVHHPHLTPQLPGHLAHNMSAMAAAAAAAATTPQHQQQMTPQTAQQAAVAAAAAAANSMNSLNSLNSITSLINAERLPNEQFLGLNPQEASILNFLRVDAQERQRDKRPPASRFACPFCGKCVRSKENLKLHVRKHTGERPFVCLFCGRAFGGKSDLTRHLRIHTGERPYHCESCGKCFARADYLSKHLTTHIHNAPR